MRKPEINVRRLLKENVKQYAKVVNTLPAGGDSNDISSAMFRQMAASCGIHVEDPRSFPDNFEEQKNTKTLDTLQNIESSVVQTENPFEDGLSNLDSNMQSLKLEYSAVEVSSKKPEVNLSTAWNPNWMNNSFYLNKTESYSPSSYNSKNVSENSINQDESSIGFESDTGENATMLENTSDENESANSSTQNLCFTPIKKEWPNNFHLDSSQSCERLPVKMSTPLKSSGIEARDRLTDIMNVSTQTDFIFSHSLDAPKKETFSQGNQTSVLLKDASVNTWQLCTCSDPDSASQIGSPLTSTEITKVTDDSAWVSF